MRSLVRAPIVLVLSTLLVFAAYALVFRRARVIAPRLGLGRVNAGIVLGVVALAAAWAAALPGALAATWWDRRRYVQSV